LKDTRIIYFFKIDNPFKGFYSTWTSAGFHTHKEALVIIKELKKHPYITNIQYQKVKHTVLNPIAISLRTKSDEAAFVLYSSGGIKIDWKY
jgi:hypothetical protein